MPPPCCPHRRRVGRSLSNPPLSHYLPTVSTAITTMVVSWIDAAGAAVGRRHQPGNTDPPLLLPFLITISIQVETILLELLLLYVVTVIELSSSHVNPPSKRWDIKKKMDTIIYLLVCSLIL